MLHIDDQINTEIIIIQQGYFDSKVEMHKAITQNVFIGWRLRAETVYTYIFTENTPIAECWPTHGRIWWNSFVLFSLSQLIHIKRKIV